MLDISQLKKDLQQLANPKQAALLQRFFKTGPGEYGEGDIFLGIKVPVQREAMKKYKDLPLADIQKLLKSKIHEHRLVALFILVDQYKSAGDVINLPGGAIRESRLQRKIFEFYLKNTKNINNWDLVDLSAPNIVGNYLLERPRDILYKLARSKNLWERRISVLACFAFIRYNDFKDALKIFKILLNDNHDLIHKAVGWMLREIGKRDQKVEEEFLKKHVKQMPRTMLRYAIERFPERKRKFYLKK